MIKFTIDEVIEHCNKTCEQMERFAVASNQEIISKSYSEHYQVSEWLEKLKGYEKIGLTPQQLIEVDKLYLEKCREVNQLKAEIEILSKANGLLVRTNLSLSRESSKTKDESLTGLEMAQICVTLKHFQKLKEQDRLIELPCAIGTKVYFVNYARIDDSVTCSIGSGNFTYSWLDFPRQIFMTKEDAEKKMAESVSE